MTNYVIQKFMDRKKTERLFKGFGLYQILGGALTIFIIITDMIHLNSGEYILLIPAWLIFVPNAIMSILRLLCGIFAFRFYSDERIKYCIYIGIALLVVNFIVSILNYMLGNHDLVPILASFIFPGLYTIYAAMLLRFDKFTIPTKQ